jgi:hypothetical protein
LELDQTTSVRSRHTKWCILALNALAMVFCYAAPARAQLNQNCTVSILNHTVKVNANGTWVLPDIPANFGPVRARATCVVNGVSQFGQSALFTIAPKGNTNVPPIVLGNTTPIPSSVSIAAPSMLSQGGATAQLAVTATYASGLPQDVTSAASGTVYNVSNPGVATVSTGGIVTAVSTGTVVIQAVNEGTQGITSIQVILAGSSHEGIPDDWAVSHGLDPTDPAMPFEDPDHDGLTNLQEFQKGTDPHNPDTDGDGLTDGQEVLLYHTNPGLVDTDGDGIPDGVEVQLGSDPNNPASGNLAAAISSLEIKPSHFSIITNAIIGEAAQQLQVLAHLIDGKTTVDLTSTLAGTTYSSSDLTICNFGFPDGDVFAGSSGVCTITVGNNGFTASATAVIQDLPAALSWISIPGFANKVRVNGNYAYVAAGSAGLQIVDVSNHVSPRIAATLSLPGNANELRLVGNLAYMAVGSAGLTIVDITNPLSPTVVGSIGTSGVSWDVAVSGNFAFVAEGTSGLQVFNISNPASPALVGSTAIPGNAEGVDAQGNFAVVAAGSSGLQIVSVSDPTTPVVVGHVAIPMNDARKVAARGTTAFVAAGTASLQIVDFSNPSAPKIIGTTSGHVDTSGNDVGGYLTDVALFPFMGNLLSFGADVHFVDGVPITNVSTPNNPISVAVLDFSKCPGCRDDNGTGIAVDNNYVYLTNERGVGDNNGTTEDTRLYIGQYAQLQDTAGIPPTVSITSPASGSTIHGGGAASINVSAIDDVAVAAVNILINGQVVFSTTTKPYQYTFQVPPNGGSFVFGAEAFDFGGNVGTAANVTITNQPLVSLAVTPANAILPLNATQIYTATGTYADGTTANITGQVTWTSSAINVATINTAAAARIVGPGQTTIQATLGTITGSTTLSKLPASLVSLTVTPGVVTIAEGSTQQFTATTRDTDNVLQDVTGSAMWNSSATNIATISATGLSTALAPGQTTITATFGALRGSATLSTRSFFSTGSMITPRESHTATLLNNGMVLLVGGFSETSVLASAELYDPSTGNWTATGNLQSARYDHTATLLNNGTVLIAGGTDASNTPMSSAELYDPAANSFSSVGSLSAARTEHSATLLNDGTVLFVGGGTLVAEIYDPVAKTFTTTRAAPLSGVGAQPTTTLLNDGTVLIVSEVSSELYNPATQSFSVGPSYILEPAIQPTATPLNGGSVLFAGGFFSTEAVAGAATYSPGAQKFTFTGSMSEPRTAHTATLLNNGSVLVTGGTIGEEISLNSAELYNPVSRSFSSPSNLVMSTSRFSHTATLLNNGSVLVAGGTGAGVFSRDITATAELYPPPVLTPPGLLSISVTPAPPVVVPGSAQRLTATGTFSDGSTQLLNSVTWSSTDLSGTNIAQITNDATNRGTVYGLEPGTATITATAGSISGSATLTVTTLVSISVTPSNPSIPSGTTQQFTATGKYPDGSTQDLTTLAAWSSSSNATVDNRGLATGVGIGQATIQASYGPIQGTATLTVTAPVLVSIAVTPADPSVAAGTREQFAATGTYTDGSILNLTGTATWNSSTQGVATISASGFASGVSVGQTSIQATVGLISNSTTLTVASSGLGFAGDLATARNAQTETLLNNGKVLIAGGLDNTGSPSATAEIYDPANQTFTATGNLIHARAHATATLLNDGTILIVGGGDYGAFSASAEIYNPATGSFASTGSLSAARGHHSAILLNNGKVLIVGGQDNARNPSTISEVYDPATGTFSLTGSLNVARSDHTATLLSNGTVLIAGGCISNCVYGAGNPTTSAEIYDPGSGSFTPTMNLRTARFSHTATLLDDSTVLIVGGVNGGTASEIFDPVAGSFTPSASLQTARYWHTATLLNNGTLLVAGGSTDPNEDSSATLEVYDPATKLFTGAGSLSVSRSLHTATLLNDGTVLIAGGYTGNNDTFVPPSYIGYLGVASAELYVPPIAPLVSISVTPAAPTLSPGTVQQFTATGTFQDGSMKPLISARWSSSNTIVAQITNDKTDRGVAADLTEGNATITATVGSVQGSTTLSSASLLASITVSPANGLVALGATQQFIAMGMFSDGTNHNITGFVTWSSSVPAVATISSGGLVAPSSLGITTITATLGTISGSTMLTVTPPPLVSIAVSPADSAVALGKAQQFTAIGTDSNGETYDVSNQVTWSSSAPDVAQISATGLASTFMNGTTTISADFEGTIGLAGLRVTMTMPGTFGSAGTNMGIPRVGHTATILADGTVAIIGGFYTPAGNAAGMVEIYQPDARNFAEYSPGLTPRGDHTATLLNDGRILLVGGSDAGVAMGKPELYNPTTQNFTSALNNTDVLMHRQNHTATLLNNGTVLIVGGFNENGPVATVELYDPATDSYMQPASLNVPRYGHTATLLNDGRVLIAGGFDSTGAALSSVEIFDATGENVALLTSHLTTPRANHSATLLNNGQVLIAGGTDGTEVLNSTDIYDSSATAIFPGANLVAARQKHAATLLNNGQVLIIAGSEQDPSMDGDVGNVDLYDPATNTVASTDANFVASIDRQTATLLLDGSVLVAGGEDSQGNPLTNAALYVPLTITPPGLTSISVSPANLTQVGLGTAQRFVALDQNGQRLASVTWSTSDFNTAISNDASNPGTAYFGALGPLTVTACDGAICGSETATVVPSGGVSLVSITVTPNSASIPVGSSLQFTALGNYQNGGTQDLSSIVTWSSTLPDIATISPSGLATSAGSTACGSTIIEATFPEIFIRGFSTLSTTRGVNSPGSWDCTAGSLSETRYNSTATVLDNGKVLIAGGSDNTAELFDPDTASYTSIFATMLAERSKDTATLLNDGRVLIAGDLNSTPPSADIYDPASATFSVVQPNMGRIFTTATLLNNGKVLIAGGATDNTSFLLGHLGAPAGGGNPTNTAELFDPATGNFATIAGVMSTSRQLHTATLLNNGKVLIAGGSDNTGYLATAELYDPASGTFTPTGSMAYARVLHTATLLNNGMVLIAGGTNDVTGTIATAELYDPASGAFRPAGTLAMARASHTATLLTNGTVLVAGGVDANLIALSTAEIYDPTVHLFTAATGLDDSRSGHTAVLLADGTGRLLLSGGGNSSFGLLSGDLYTPLTQSPPQLVSISVAPAVGTLSLAQGAAEQFIATGKFSDGSQQQLASVRWTSSSTSVAQITNDVTNRGTVLAVAAGSSTLTATVGTSTTGIISGSVVLVVH